MSNVISFSIFPTKDNENMLQEYFGFFLGKFFGHFAYKWLIRMRNAMVTEISSNIELRSHVILVLRTIK